METFTATPGRVGHVREQFDDSTTVMLCGKSFITGELIDASEFPMCKVCENKL